MDLDFFDEKLFTNMNQLSLLFSQGVLILRPTHHGGNGLLSCLLGIFCFAFSSRFL